MLRCELHPSISRSRRSLPRVTPPPPPLPLPPQRCRHSTQRRPPSAPLRRAHSEGLRRLLLHCCHPLVRRALPLLRASRDLSTAAASALHLRLPVTPSCRPPLPRRHPPCNGALRLHSPAPSAWDLLCLPVSALRPLASPRLPRRLTHCRRRWQRCLSAKRARCCCASMRLSLRRCAALHP